jgi:hypothetical protein
VVYALANHHVNRLLSALPNVTVRKSYFKDQDMSHTRIAIVAALGNISSEASARGRLFPLTRCGPDLAYLCPMDGYLIWHPSTTTSPSIQAASKVVAVQTPELACEFDK